MTKGPGKTKTGKALRNYEITKGILRFSKSKIYHRRRLFDPLVKNSSRRKQDFEKYKQKVVDKSKSSNFVVKSIGGEKNGGQRRVLKNRLPRSYPLLKKVAIKHRRIKARTFKSLRPSLIPGKILILVAGPHRGKRVIFLQRLPKSGMLLITGPYKLNGCPLRRAHESRVIATSEMVPNFELDKIIEGYKQQVVDNETTFFTDKKKKEKTKKSKEEDIFESSEKNVKLPLPDFKKEIQKNIDNRLLALIDGAITDNEFESRFMKKYLSLPFALKPGQCPHKMVF